MGHFDTNKELIYLASPFTHDDPAVMRLRYELALKATASMIRDGHLIYSPIVHFYPMATTFEFPMHYEFWRMQILLMLYRVDALRVLAIPGWQKSTGVRDEMHLAQERFIPIDYMILDSRTPGVLGSYKFVDLERAMAIK